MGNSGLHICHCQSMITFGRLEAVLRSVDRLGKPLKNGMVPQVRQAVGQGIAFVGGEVDDISIRLVVFAQNELAVPEHPFGKVDQTVAEQCCIVREAVEGL